jgi:hypothetical protein
MTGKILEWDVLHTSKGLYKNGSKRVGTDWQQSIRIEKGISFVYTYTRKVNYAAYEISI